MKLGTIIGGKFRIERVIGRGAMGVVLEATDVLLGRRIAVKLILPQHAEDRELRGRFIREATVMTRLASEHVARVLEVGELEDGMLFLAMEYLEGQSLEQLIQDGGPLPAADAVDLLLEVLDAIAEAHDLGLVHRDLKPSNMFLAARKGKDPILKVLDFGIVKDSASTAKLTATGTLPGTPAYMAPEQIALEEDLIDARADVWSLGVTLFEILTGELPFNGPINVMLARIRSEAPPRIRARRPDVAPELEAIIEKCLSKHPADRFANAGELKMALGDLRTRGLVRSERGAERRAVSTVISAQRAARSAAITEGEPSGPQLPGTSSGGGGGRGSGPYDIAPTQQARSGRALPILLFVIGLCVVAGLVLALQGRLSRLMNATHTQVRASSSLSGSESASTSTPVVSDASVPSSSASSPPLMASASASASASAATSASAARPRVVRHPRIISARNTGDRAWKLWMNQHRQRIEGCAAMQPCGATLTLRLTKVDAKSATGNVTIQGTPAAMPDNSCTVHPTLIDCMTDLAKEATPPLDTCTDPADCHGEVIMAFE